MKQKKYRLAEEEINTYLTFDTNDYQKGYAYYYKGHILMRQKKYKKAEKAYNMAWKVNKIKSAKERAALAKEKQRK